MNRYRIVGAMGVELPAGTLLRLADPARQGPRLAGRSKPAKGKAIELTQPTAFKRGEEIWIDDEALPKSLAELVEDVKAAERLPLVEKSAAKKGGLIAGAFAALGIGGKSVETSPPSGDEGDTAPGVATEIKSDT